MAPWISSWNFQRILPNKRGELEKTDQNSLKAEPSRSANRSVINPRIRLKSKLEITKRHQDAALIDWIKRSIFTNEKKGQICLGLKIQSFSIKKTETFFRENSGFLVFQVLKTFCLLFWCREIVTDKRGGDKLYLVNILVKIW